MPTRDTLHRLIDELPESELAAAERFLHYLRATAATNALQCPKAERLQVIPHVRHALLGKLTKKSSILSAREPSSPMSNRYMAPRQA